MAIPPKFDNLLLSGWECFCLFVKLNLLKISIIREVKIRFNKADRVIGPTA